MREKIIRHSILEIVIFRYRDYSGKFPVLREHARGGVKQLGNAIDAILYAVDLNIRGEIPSDRKTWKGLERK